MGEGCLAAAVGPSRESAFGRRAPPGQIGEFPSMTLHLIKLCVGAESIDDLADWIERKLAEKLAAAAGAVAHIGVLARTLVWGRTRSV
jgi:hypothetical protein